VLAALKAGGTRSREQRTVNGRKPPNKGLVPTSGRLWRARSRHKPRALGGRPRGHAYTLALARQGGPRRDPFTPVHSGEAGILDCRLKIWDYGVPPVEQSAHSHR
jgi:hypothetical protein